MNQTRVARPGEAFTSTADVSWHDHAACRGEDLGLFFGRFGERLPEREVREAEAKKICQRCPVVTTCLEAELARRPLDQHGVFGATTAEERIVIRRNRLRHDKLRRAV